MKRIALAVGAGVMALALVGCTHSIGTFSLVAAGAPNIEQIPQQKNFARDVEADDGRFWLLFIPFDGAPSLEEAAQRTLSKGNGDFIENARFYSTCWTAILFSYDSYSVIGNVGNTGTIRPKENVVIIDTD